MEKNLIYLLKFRNNRGQYWLDLLEYYENGSQDLSGFSLSTDDSRDEFLNQLKDLLNDDMPLRGKLALANHLINAIDLDSIAPPNYLF